MDADLVPFGNDAALLVGVEQRGDGRHIERRLDAVRSSSFRMRGTPTRAPYWPQASRPIDLPPSRRSLVSWSLSNDSATAQRAPPGHSRRPQRPPGAHPGDQLAPMLLGPLPGFEIGFGRVHQLSPRSSVFAAERPRKWSER